MSKTRHVGTALVRRCAFLALAAIIAAAAGCGMSYNAPPTVQAGEMPPASWTAGKPVVVIGHFDNPKQSPLPWPSIGQDMSEALGRTILNHGKFEVWIDPPLVEKVKTAILLPPEQRRVAVAQLQREHPRVRLVVGGRVTDFTHTSDKPREARRRGMIGLKQEAVVAIEVGVVDLHRGRLVVTDHLVGTAKAPRKSTARVYENIAFGSYLYWNTPLGKASEQVLERTLDVLNASVPTGQGVRVVGRAGASELRIDPSDPDAVPGGEYFVCRVDDATGAHRPLIASDATGDPLRARVEIRDGTPLARLLTPVAQDVDFTSTRLCRVPSRTDVAGVQ